MLNTTVPKLVCPTCRAGLKLFAERTYSCGTPEVFDVITGALECTSCENRYPILAGVAVLTSDIEEFIFNHIKGILKLVPEADIPLQYLEIFKEARDELEDLGDEHIEEDLESDRVTALYLMTHYLNSSQVTSPSPLIQDLLKKHWDHGPFDQIKKWIPKSKPSDVVELGCGVGGLATLLRPNLKSYLGVDSSFVSIALARHLNLGTPYPGAKLKVPEDLLHGSLSRDLPFPAAATFDGTIDFVVADFTEPPLLLEQWDVSIALNTIDMMEEPQDLPKAQYQLIRKGGLAIQSCPYIWHEIVATELRQQLPDHSRVGIKYDSARAVEWLYEQTGFTLLEKIDHLPWLFFKHNRQLEIYSVHLFLAQKF